MWVVVGAGLGSGVINEVWAQPSTMWNVGSAPGSEYVVVGTGVAAYAAVSEMVSRGVAASSITVVGEEPAGVLLADLEPEGWGGLIAQGVRVVEDKGVVKIDSVQHLLELSDSSSLSYGKCVLAPMDVAAVPPIGKMIDQSAVRRVFATRHRRCRRRLEAALEKGVKRVTVVGGGWAGCELACDLAQKGLDVTIVFSESAPLSRWAELASVFLVVKCAADASVACRYVTATVAKDMASRLREHDISIYNYAQVSYVMGGKKSAQVVQPCQRHHITSHATSWHAGSAPEDLRQVRDCQFPYRRGPLLPDSHPEPPLAARGGKWPRGGHD